MKTEQIITTALSAFLVAGLFGCSGSGEKAKEGFDKSREISVITREAGSGTRDAFVELTGILVKKDGQKKDNTTPEALTIDGTQAVMSNVAGNEYAMGYISLGSLNPTVKAINVSGIEATAAMIKEGTYPLARPFNIATKTSGTLSDLAKDFIWFILSADGQAVAEKNGYVSVSQGAPYKATKLTGKIVIAGSSSVSPLMEKLKEAYIALNPEVEIEIQTNDSSSGMLAAKEGTCDIGMASRALKDSESSELTATTIAKDGIAVIVNQKNPIANVSLETLRQVYTGAARTWGSVLN